MSTSMNTASSAAVSQLQRMDFSKGRRLKAEPLDVTKMTDAEFRGYKELRKSMLDFELYELKWKYTDKSIPEITRDQQVAMADYAQIFANGRVVARLDNQGNVMTDNRLGESIRNSLLNSVNGKQGPVLAQARAQQIAKHFGGEVRLAQTAVSQETFDGLEITSNHEMQIDIKAMENDPEYTKINEKYKNLQIELKKGNNT